MAKLLALICAFIALSTVHSQSCTPTNSLRTAFNLANSLTDAKSYSDIKYCKSIKSSPVCCTNDDMNTFQDKTTKMLTNMTTLVSARDVLMTKALTDAVPQLTSAMNNLQSSMASLGSEASVFALELVSALTKVATGLSSVSGDIKATYTNFQKNRQTCVVQMMKIQAATFCLACDPSATSKGFNSTSGTITYSASLCKKVNSQCSAYFTNAMTTESFILAEYAIGVLNGLTQLIKSVQSIAASGDQAAIANFDFEAKFEKLLATPTGALAPVDPLCDATTNTCDDLCDALFTDNGLINQDVLVNGGVPFNGTDFLGDRRLTQSKKQGGRRLDSQDFDPSDDEAQVDVTFSQDPGHTQSASLSFGNVLVGMMVLVSCMFVF